MIIAMHATKLVVQDLTVTEPFYRAIGFKVVSRNLGGENEVRQSQCWLSATGDSTSHILILSQFLELPPPPRPVYPGEVWLAIQVADVEETERAVRAAGGNVVRAGQDRPEHQVRAAVVSDPEGHLIEVVGPMAAA
jgi:catechol 2,3-dioxygenase-like lactoylglutathione lyase family enzyme